MAEDPAVKRDLLALLGDVLPGGRDRRDDHLVTVDRRPGGGQRPARALRGLHVFNPVERMELVELVLPGRRHRGHAAPRARAVRALGKNAVEVPDIPGFVVNRLLFPFLFEAVRLADEAGLEPEAVDTCMKLGAGHPMGPLALLDFVGLDVAAAIGE